MKYLIFFAVTTCLVIVSSSVGVWAIDEELDERREAAVEDATEALESTIEDVGNLVCPVMGGEVDKNISYVHEGKRYYFCCPGCVETFKADPEKYLKKSQGLSGTLEDGVRVVKVKAFKYGFDPDPILVKKDEKVRLEVTSADVAHGLGIQELGINLVGVKGETEIAEFISQKTGEFHIHCTVYCGPGHSKMHGTLKVIE